MKAELLEELREIRSSQEAQWRREAEVRWRGILQVAGFDPQLRSSDWVRPPVAEYSGWVRPPVATPQNPPGWLTPVSVLRDKEPTSL